jgi:hypothetical protein
VFTVSPESTVIVNVKPTCQPQPAGTPENKVLTSGTGTFEVVSQAEMEALFLVVDPSCSLSYEVVNVGSASSLKISGASASVDTTDLIGGEI